MILPANRNPKYNSTINPKFNSGINPRYNSIINPKYNSTINPKYNSTINPKYNSTINPKYNSTINPKYNSTINPKYNSTINPKFNSSINPNFNSLFGGLYIFNLDSDLSSFVVSVNDRVIQIFNFDLENIMFGIVHNKGGYVLFSDNTEFIGHFESDSQNGFNQFDESGEWVAFVK